MRTAVSLLGIGLIGVTVTFGACLVVLKHDVGQIQAQHAAQKPASQDVTCADLAHVRLRVHGRTARCVAR